MPVIPHVGNVMYTWHLSVVDGGQPRELAGDALVQLTAVGSADEILWQDGELEDGEWILPGATADGKTTSVRLRHFGVRGGTPISGDFNGDGKFEVGFFKDGKWFVNLNANGVWDEGDLWARLRPRRPAGHR